MTDVTNMSSCPPGQLLSEACYTVCLRWFVMYAADLHIIMEENLRIRIL